MSGYRWEIIDVGHNRDNGRALLSGGSRRSDNHPDPEIRGGGGRSPKKCFSALRALVWSNNKGGPGPPGPSPKSATATNRYKRQFSLWQWKGDEKHPWLVFFFSCSRYSNRHRGLETASLNVSKQALMEIKTHIEETSTVPKTKSFLLNLAYKKTFQDVTN